MADKSGEEHSTTKVTSDSDDPVGASESSISHDGNEAIPISVGGGSPRSSRFVISSSVAGSPPQFVTLEEIMNAATGVVNMHLIHEIVMDSKFSLKKYEPPQDSLEKVVKETVHKAFWDLLLEELNGNPPKYTRAMQLLEEIKSELLSLLPAPQSKLKQEINEMLDIPLIQQQAENNSLDFLSYVHYTLGLMGRMCAPVRDDDIKELGKATDIVEIFKGIFEILTKMKLDFANFSIELFRPELIANSVEYEKTRFAELLKVDGGIDGLVNTKKWLRKHVQKVRAEKPRCLLTDVMPQAYLELLEWNEEEPAPETIAIDFARLRDLSVRLYRLIVMGSILIVTLSHLKYQALQSNQLFEDKLLEEVSIILQDTRDDKMLKDLLPNLVVQALQVSQKFLMTGVAAGSPEAVKIDTESEKSLTVALQDLGRPDHPVRNLVERRVKEFLHLALISISNVPHNVPSGLSSLKPQLLSLTASVVRVYKYNQAVFGEYYSDLITKISEELSV